MDHGPAHGLFRKLLPESRSSQGELSNDTKIIRIDREERFQITLTTAQMVNSRWKVKFTFWRKSCFDFELF